MPPEDVSRKTGFDTGLSLEGLETDEQRRVLDTVAEIRKCGLEGILSLPQIVVCGSQSSGKSSVLEALTEIPFPRNDNLCTRFATEIILRRAPIESLKIRLIPDAARPSHEQDHLKSFEETVADFSELPNVMAVAMVQMGLDEVPSSGQKAFTRDILSVEIEGPCRPQLTLIDIPGLIQTETKGVTSEDIDMVNEITERYIRQPRTICLAVVAATHDYANQPILTRVRDVDPEGDRTLGIITKPDRLDAGSGSEKGFISLARNEDIFFKLGWHVVKNRSFAEASFSLEERLASETAFFKSSNFNCLSRDSLGIDTLRDRLSVLLFEHLKNEMPRLRKDLEDILSEARHQLSVMGKERITEEDCKTYLTELSLDFYEVCKASVDGRYEGVDFADDVLGRIRARVQFLNAEFETNFGKRGHKYHIEMTDNDADDGNGKPIKNTPNVSPTSPIYMTRSMAREWVLKTLVNSRGRELIGNYNPLVIGELFWEQSCNWREMAVDHLDQVSAMCETFLRDLLKRKCPRDIRARLWSIQIEAKLKTRHNAASDELELLVEDNRNYPINYNHYYTDTILKRRHERESQALQACIDSATSHSHLPGCHSNHSSTNINTKEALDQYYSQKDSNLNNFGCEEILDCLLAIYKVQQKVFVANVTTQVIERHVIRSLERILSPLDVNKMSSSEAQSLVSEATSAQRQRQYLKDKISKLEDGQSIFKRIMGYSSTA